LKSDVDALLALVNGGGRLSSATLDARFDAKADDGDIPAAISAYDTATVQPLADTINTGRLSQTALDTRYVKNPPQPHAVFIGSSNSTPGTWTENFCTAMGYVGHNYSISGGSFTGAGAGNFLAQANTAIADTSYDHSLVKYFFICDMGNDIRATASISANAPAVFSAIRTAYPKARIILLPAVWGNADDNNIGGRVASISMRVQEARNASMPFDVEMVEWSWLWLADENSWMLPAQVHPNPDGYARIGYFMQKYMNGESTRYDRGWKFIAPLGSVVPTSAYWRASREGNYVTLEDQFVLSGAIGVDQNIGQLEYGLWPINPIKIGVVADTTRALNTIEIFPTGLIRSFGALAADLYTLDVTYRAF
jgi:lysophospholipase L1-like esterase